MRKFTKVLESLESDIVEDIKDILVDFGDNGFKIDIENSVGFIDITIKNPNRVNAMEVIHDLSVSDKRIRDLKLEYIDSSIRLNHVDSYSVKGSADIKVRYKLATKADKNVNGWKEFKDYCEKVLGVTGIEGEMPQPFRLHVVSLDGWGNIPEDVYGWAIDIPEDVYGWVIDIGDNVDVDKFVSKFPGYEDFFRKIIGRKLDWDLLWHYSESKSRDKHNPMKFDREGIEAVETFLEIARKYPHKIKIHQSKI